MRVVVRQGFYCITNHVATARVGFPQLVIDNVVITLAGFLLRLLHNIVTVHFLLINKLNGNNLNLSRYWFCNIRNV